VSGHASEDDRALDPSFRPSTFDDFVGQDEVVEELRLAIDAAKTQGKVLDHILLVGPPGVGKTSLAHLIADGLGTPVRATGGLAIEDLLDAVFTARQHQEVLFVDEIHRVAAKHPAILSSNLGAESLDYILPEKGGTGERSWEMPTTAFTLVGTTTRERLLTARVRACFPIVHSLDLYAEEELCSIVTRSARILGVPIKPEAAEEIARRSRGTPRVANRLLRCVRDFALAQAEGFITHEVAEDALNTLHVDWHRIDDVDRKLLCSTIDKFSGGPVAISALSFAIREEADVIEDRYPYLQRLGMLDWTTQGFVATEVAYEHFGRLLPEAASVGDAETTEAPRPDIIALMDALKASLAKKEAGIESPALDENPQLQDLLEELDRLVGLEPVKEEVRSLTNLLRLQALRRACGMKVAPMSFHLVFTGNPGTGKTTVARILAGIYGALGLLTKGHLVETDRAGLVAAHIGGTALKTQEVVVNALGGALFIDEAYSLAGKHEWDFGGEAIETLLKMMEDHREDLVVIVAGYPERMRTFIGSNPGLQSRFTRFLNFPDYGPEDLGTILDRLVDREGYALTPEARQQALVAFGVAHAQRDATFGNGRFVRTFFEGALARLANRLAAATAPLTAHELSLIQVADLPLNETWR
jgi:holliday junction DNA helicase RuvB